jgi:hypothetical protein
MLNSTKAAVKQVSTCFIENQLKIRKVNLACF